MGRFALSAGRNGFLGSEPIISNDFSIDYASKEETIYDGYDVTASIVNTLTACHSIDGETPKVSNQ